MVKRNIIHTISVLFVISSLFANSASAALGSFDLKPTSTTYTTTGTVSIDKDSSSNYTVTAVVKNLPSPLPASGVYYLFWGLQPDGRAFNLGPITNDSQINKSITSKMAQFFITSEKERFPEYVNGPRIAQTDTIPESIYTNLTSPTPTPSGIVIATPRPSSYSTPTGAPETGLGGGVIWQLMIAGLGVFGLTGLTYSIAKRHRNK
jgi:hypothetical protein